MPLSVRKKAAWKCDACGSETASSVSHDSRGVPEPSLSTLLDAFQCLGKNLGSQITELKTCIVGVQRESEGVNNTIGAMQTTLTSLVSENEVRKSEYAKLEQENKELSKGMAELHKQVREMEQYSRRDNVEIVGIPLTRGENVHSVLSELAKTGCVSSPQTAYEGRANYPSIIIVKFISRDDKMDWMRAAREGRDRLNAAALVDSWPATPIYINDHLTPHFKMLLGRAKRYVREKRLAFAWTRDCRVFARKTAHPDCPPTLLRTPEDLDQLLL
ncbi:hypothetical protein J6590_076690 [Homalodisca vitripennis]|nr:hypothetical protein J6590_076690 [Homalodisca vitripennis]